MRLHSLELQAFLAFPGRERIDFDALNDAGLFLLTGRTGAGKSAVLDAVTFALYGQVPGTRAIKALRSDHAAPDVPTEVVLEVTLRDRRLRIVRRPEQERPVLRGTGTTTAKASVTLTRIEDDGTETVLSTRLDEAGHELGGLLGMTKEQFCQVVLLPQGGFQKFLHAPTKERIPLLRELFDVRRFADAERWLEQERHRCSREAEGVLRELRDTLAAARHVATAGREDEVLPERWEERPTEAAAWLDEQIVVAEASHLTATTALEQASTAREHAEIRHGAGLRLAELQQAAAEAARSLEAWEATRPQRDALATELDLARRAAPAAAHAEAWRSREAAARAAGAAADAACAAARTAGVGLPQDAGPADAASLADGLRRDAGAAEALAPVEHEVAEESRRLATVRRGCDDLAQRCQELARDLEDETGARPAARTAVERAQQAAAALPGLRDAAAVARERAAHARVRDELAAQIERAAEDHLRAREAAATAVETHLRLQRRRLDGIAAELAQRLRDGEACAVCGALEHPAPAPAPESGLVGEAALEAAAEDEARLVARREALGTALNDLRARHAGAVAAAGEGPADVLAAAADAAARELQAATALADGLDGAREVLDTREGAIARLEQELQEARVRLATLQADHERRVQGLQDSAARVEAARAGAPSIAERVAALTRAAEAADAVAAALAEAGRTRAEADAALDAARAAARHAGFDDLDALTAALRTDEAIAALEQRVRTWDDTLAARRTTAAQDEFVDAAARPVPDVDVLAAALRDAKAAEGGASTALSDVLRRRSELRGLSERLAATITASGPVLERRAVITELAELAAGRSTSNRFNMSLSTYVLAARLEEVAAAATVRLQRMTDGRYALEHADDTAKGRSLGGLDLRVVDAWTGQRRAPSSLSGGETFMASLALALGLADTVTAQAGGLRLDTLFVDEGFGSLDDEGTLDNVLEALDALREGGRTVGLVSHVAELRQRIPVQVRVEKGRDGSTISALRTPAGA